MPRRTKIVCTLGPASSDADTIGRLMDAGMDVVRLNFSHGTHEEHGKLIETVRQVAKSRGRVVPILQDLQGPKIRVGEIKKGGALLHEGSKVVLTSEPFGLGKAKRLFVNHPRLSEDVEMGGRILLDDGRIELEVLEIKDQEVVTKVIVGGPIWSNKGVNLPNMQSNSSSLTEKDERDLEFGLKMEVDLVALSFVRTEKDVVELVSRIRESGKHVGVIAKIEKPEAVEDIDDILGEADGIMVARGDLGIEMKLSQVPMTQKRIVNRCLQEAKPVITATQMLESMTHSPRPTRAEASDVANAVLDGTDAVMLSAETAAGQHPVRVVEVMNEIVCAAEAEYGRYNQPFARSQRPDPERLVTNAISHTATQLAVNINAVAIACLTHSGTTARWISSHRPGCP
ncbi:MAG: pyruvate kinase, partial [Candidatus Latescibacterota bacterium]